MKVTMISPAVLKPYWRNPRKIEKAIPAVKASIEKYGFRQPIVVDGDNVILVGHTRYKAALELGLTKVPVHVAADLTPEQAKAYRIADNKSNELSEWDNTLLIPELREMTNIDDLSVFFPHTDLEMLLRETSGTAGTSFEPPTLEEITEAQAKNDERFEVSGRATEADMIEMTCPHCGEDFQVSRGDILRRPAAAA